MVIGIIFSVVALVGWGLGDFFIQRTVRKTSVPSAVCYIGLFASIALLPFVWHEIPLIWSSQNNLFLIGGLAILTLVCAIVEFAAFGEGKIAVLEPVLSSELPLTVILGVALLHETLSLWQVVLMIAVFIGITLVVTVQAGHLRHRHVLLERGTLLALFSVVGLAVGNVLVAMASRNISPLLTVWSTFLFIGISTFLYIIMSGKFGQFVNNFKQNKILVLAESFFDTLGWVAFAYATTYTSLAIATTISESYVILAIGLGLYFNKEKLRLHQLVGLPIAIVAILVFSTS